MKAVVVELKNGFAAVLSDDGCVVTIKNKNYEIGQVIQMNNRKIHFNKKIAAFAASAAACLLLGVGGWAYASPYTYVSLDVNPSIEFSVNRFDRVLSVKAVNDDGEEILQEISLNDLENKTIYDALATTVAQISEAGYFDSDIEGGIVIATSSEDKEKAEELAQELQETVEQESVENGDDVAVEAFSVGQERVDEARELGVTPGKLNLVEKLQAAAGESAEINMEEWLTKPVKDIMKATKDYKKAVTEAAQVEDSTDEDAGVQTEDAKALEKAEKAAEQAKEKADKADQKAKKAEQKAKDKADKAALKAKEAAEETDEDQIEAAEDAAKIAAKEAEDAKIAADKAKEEAKKATEKAKKAEAAKKAAEKTNTVEDASDDSAQTTDMDSSTNNKDSKNNSIKDNKKNQYNHGKADDASDNDSKDYDEDSNQSYNGNSESGSGQNSGKSDNSNGKSGNNK